MALPPGIKKPSGIRLELDPNGTYYSDICAAFCPTDDKKVGANLSKPDVTLTENGTGTTLAEDSIGGVHVSGFSGSDWLEIANYSGLHNSNGLTVIAIVLHNGFAADNGAICQDKYTSQVNFMLSPEGSNSSTTGFGGFGGAWGSWANKASLTQSYGGDGQVHVVAGRYENGSLSARTYLDGAVDNTGSVSGTIPTEATPVMIGKGQDNGYWNGKIYAVFKFNRGLTDAEIAEISADPYKTLLRQKDSIYSAEVVRKNPIAHYKCDDTTTTCPDNSNNFYEGTWSAAPAAASDSPEGLTNGVVLDNTKYSTLPAGVATDIAAASAITIEAWFKTTKNTDTNSNENVIFGSNTAADGDAVRLGVDGTAGGNGRIFYTVAGTSNHSVANGFNDGNWHHIVYAIDDTANTQLIWVDGVEVVNNTLTTDLTIVAKTFISNENDGASPSDHFDGSISDVAIYDFAFTQGSAKLHYDLGIADEYAQSIAQDTPIAWWRLDESSGTEALDYVGANEGTYNGTYTLDQAGLVSTGKSVNFNGSSGRVDIGTLGNTPIGDLINGKSVVTVEAWVSSDVVPTTESEDIWYSEVNSIATGFGIAVNSSGLIFAGGRSGSADAFQSTSWTTAITAGVTYHVVGVLDYANNTIKLYVNGDLKNTNSTAVFANSTYTLGTPTNGENIGMAPNNARHWDGEIDEVAVYDYELTATQVLAHFKHQGLNSITPVGNLALTGKIPVKDGALTPYDDAVIASNPTCYYRMQSVNDVADFTGNLGNISYINSPVNNDASWDAPRQNSVYYGSTTDYALATGGGFDEFTTAGTIECWIRFASFSDNGRVIYAGTATTSSMLGIIAHNNTGIQISRFGSEAGQVTGMDLNKWYHLVLTNTGNSQKLYLNGVQRSTASYSVTIADRLVINGESGENCNTYCSHIAYYPRELGVSEIRSHYFAGAWYVQARSDIHYYRALMEDTPHRYWPMTERYGGLEAIAESQEKALEYNDSVTGSYVGPSWVNVGGPTFQLYQSKYKGGGSERLEDTSSSVTYFNTSGGSIELWCRVDSWSGAWSRIAYVGANNVSNGNFTIIRNSTSGNINLSNTASNVAAQAITLGQWMHVVGTVDGSGNVALYVNNNKTTGSFGGALNLSTTETRFGASTSAEGFQGAMCHGAIYDYPLTDQQVAAHYNAGLQTTHEVNINNRVFNGELEALYLFTPDHIDGTTVEDLSGKGHDMTLVNGPTADSQGLITFNKASSQYGDIGTQLPLLPKFNIFASAFPKASAVNTTITARRENSATWQNTNFIAYFDISRSKTTLVQSGTERSVTRTKTYDADNEYGLSFLNHPNNNVYAIDTDGSTSAISGDANSNLAWPTYVARDIQQGYSDAQIRVLGILGAENYIGGASGVMAYDPLFFVDFPEQTGSEAQIPLGSLTLTGLTPGAQADVQKSEIPTGALALSELTPQTDVSDKQWSNLVTGALTITGLAVSVNANSIEIEFTPGALAIAGLAPQAAAFDPQSSEIPAGALTFAGLTPEVQVLIINASAIPVGTIDLTGMSTATNYTENKLSDAGIGSLTITGNVPSIEYLEGKVSDTPLGTMALTGLNPDTYYSGDVYTRFIGAPENLNISGFAGQTDATEHKISEAEAGSLSLTGLDTDTEAFQNKLAEIGIGSITLTGNTPDVEYLENKLAAPPSGNLGLFGPAPGTYYQTALPDFLRVNLGMSQWVGFEVAVSQAPAYTCEISQNPLFEVEISRNVAFELGISRKISFEIEL